MKERGILFNDDMARAINAGRKTVTRRPIKEQPPATHRWRGWVVDSTDSKQVGMASWGVGDGGLITEAVYARCPYGMVGDRLYVREAHCINDYRGANVPEDERADCQIIYRADGLPDWEGEESLIRWTPSIHHPRWASRILLEITAVSVERLKDITEEQAKAEGCYFTDYGRKCGHGARGWNEVGDCPAPEAHHPQREGWMWKPTTSPDECLGSARMAFANLWNATGGEWDANPWVWAIEFKVINENPDS